MDTKWGIIVKPSPLGDITVETYATEPSREAAAFMRVVATAVNRYVRQHLKREAHYDKARKAKRKKFKALMKGAAR